MDMEKVTVIDFHAHILPELDHGCDSAETAKEQLTLAAKAGVDTVVATSHFYPHVDTVNSFLRAREDAYKNLKGNLSKEDVYPQVLLGAEVLACPKIEQMEGLEQLCIQGTNVLLLEMPLTGQWEKSLPETVCKLAKRFQIVLAHADRYSFRQVQPLVEAGCKIQLNAEALCKWSKKSLCKQYLQTDAVAALGSDIHGTKTGYRKFTKAQKVLGSRAVQIMKKTKELCRKAEAEQ